MKDDHRILIGTLRPEEFRAAALYLFGQMSQRMIAIEMNLSQPAVSRILKDAKVKLERLGIEFCPSQSPRLRGSRRTVPIPANLPWLA